MHTAVLLRPAKLGHLGDLRPLSLGMLIRRIQPFPAFDECLGLLVLMIAAIAIGSAMVRTVNA